MSKDWVKDINEMQYKYGVHKWIHDNRDNKENLRRYLEFRIDFLREELDETEAALVSMDSEEIVDGLIDLCVVAIGTLDWGAYVGKEALKKGAKVTISPWKKYQSESFPASTKSSGTYLNSLLAVQDAKSKGFDEALLLNLDDTIAEGSGQNFFLIKNGIFHTNDKDANILMGITRETVLELINDLGMKYKISNITKDDLFNADEAFFTGSASEITPIRKIDEHTFSNGKAGKLTLKIQELYYNIVRGKEPKYESWLTYVN